MTNFRLALLAAAAGVLACSTPAHSNPGPSQLSAPKELADHGLVESELSSTAFSTWFNKDPEGSSAVMGDLVRCAVPAGSARTWQNPSTGVRYTWYGEMGLTPSWSSGAPATSLERHLITVCLTSLKNNPAPPQARLARSRS